MMVNWEIFGGKGGNFSANQFQLLKRLNAYKDTEQLLGARVTFMVVFELVCYDLFKEFVMFGEDAQGCVPIITQLGTSLRSGWLRLVISTYLS